MLNYTLDMLTLAAIFVTSSLSLSIIVSQAGLMSLLQGAMVGIGSYAFAIITVKMGLPSEVAFLCTLATSAFFGFIVAYFIVGLQDEQFAVIALALQLLLVTVMSNWVGLTGGAYGIVQIPNTLFGFGGTRGQLLTICIAAAAILFIVLDRIHKSSFGALLRASAAGGDVVESLGTSAKRLRVIAFTIGSVGAGITGMLMAMHSTYIAPQLFELHYSILILAMVVVGGFFGRWGAIAGTVILVLVPEALRFAAFGPASSGSFRQIIFGAILVLVIFIQAERRKEV